MLEEKRCDDINLYIYIYLQYKLSKIIKYLLYQIEMEIGHAKLDS